MRRAAIAALLSTLLPAQDEAAFDRGLADVHGLMRQGKWPAAKAALTALLEQHADRIYVQAQRQAIVDDFELCSFWCTVPVPKAQDLLSGKIESFSPESGRIKLRYQSNALADWHTEGKLLIHPVTFTGPYTLTVTDASYPVMNHHARLDQPAASFCAVFDLDDDGYYIADFGMPPHNMGLNVQRLLPPSIHRVLGDKKTLIEERQISPAKPGKPFTAQIKVTRNAVEMLYDKKSTLKGKRERGDYGRVGLFAGSFDEVLIEGDIEPSWLQGVVDQKLAELREDFTGRFRPRAELPAWLFTDPKVARTLPKEVFGSRAAKSAASRAVFEKLGRGDFDGALAGLGKLGDADLAPADLQFLTAVCHLRRGDPEAARPSAERALAALPDATRTRVLQAQVLIALRNRKDALPLLQQAVADDPGDDGAIAALFVELMRGNQIDAATRLVRDSMCRHGLWEAMRELDTMLAMRRRGPSWPKRFSHETAHYAVHSDIDRKVCVDAAMQLERAYVNLKAQLGWLTEDAAFSRFEVYLFAGESGYQEYCKRILGSAPPHTAGLYSPVLKQLLIWNLPKREDMERTIQHEGFHQYLDRAMDDPPVWFNEGMAEFWETAQRENGTLVGGQVRRDHLATLVRSGGTMPTLREFVYGSRADFYKSAQLRYPQAWALVHFLRKGPNANQKTWKALWTALREPDLSTTAALDRAFQGTDWPAFSAAFWAHVRSLANAK